MSNRRKRGDPPATEPTPEPPSDPLPVVPKTRPAVSYAANSDRTTRIEMAVWARKVTVSETEEYTQYSLTVSRAWRDADGNWTGNGFYRAHDVAVLLYLVQQAHHWCLSQRTQVRMPETNGDVPF